MKSEVPINKEKGIASPFLEAVLKMERGSLVRPSVLAKAGALKIYGTANQANLTNL